MKNIIAAAAIVFALAACGDNSNVNDQNTSDSSSNITTDTGTNTSTSTGAGTLNPGDSTGINRDTSRKDRTDVRKPADTARRRSDSVR